ncbi:MAG TPA: DUF2249 domain-containing protein [Casimicrobiaceae bacterium]
MIDRQPRGANRPVQEGRAKRWVEADGIHVDVRGLPPPQPLVTILALVKSLRDATPVVVHHERDPQFLYPELAEIGWSATRIDAPAGEVRLRLERAA